MDENSEEYREQELNKLITFTKSTDDDLKSILSMLGWSLESVGEKTENYVVCPFNPGHRLPESSLQKHIEACRWKEEGYDKSDVELSEPTLSIDNPYTIKIDTEHRNKILQSAKEKDPKLLLLGVGDRLIPRTSNRIFADFTSDERAAIYDYVIANTQKIDLGQDIADLNKTKEKKEEKSISYLELLAQERNLKRRRAKHRGVHTNKKSHVEVMREVIEQQMEMFKEYLTEQGVIQCVKEEVQDVSDAQEYSTTTNSNNENTKYIPYRGETHFQKDKTDRHYRDESRREHRTYHSERNESHNSHRREKYGSNDDRYKSRERTKYRDRSKERSKPKDRSRERKRKRSKDRHRNRSNERREQKHDEYRSRKRSRSRTRY